MQEKELRCKKINIMAQILKLEKNKSKQTKWKK